MRFIIKKKLKIQSRTDILSGKGCEYPECDNRYSQSLAESLVHRAKWLDL